MTIQPRRREDRRSDALTRTQILNDGWVLRHEPISAGPDMARSVSAKLGGWLPTSLPTDVRVPLIADKQIEEPLIGENFMDSRWVEDRSWWFKTTFGPQFPLDSADLVELSIGGLDLCADVFLNDRFLGRHMNSFRPFVADVTGLIRPEGNELLVRVTCGPDQFSPEDTAATRPGFVFPDFPAESAGTRFDLARPFLRKPQYGFGWDHVPRVPSLGIMGAVVLSAFSGVAVRSIHSTVTAIEPAGHINVVVEIENLDHLADVDIQIDLTLADDAGETVDSSKSSVLNAGLNWLSLELVVENPKLWWPNGYGEQGLYDLTTVVRRGDSIVSTSVMKVGLRTVELNTEPLNATESDFAIEVNGVRIFAKGANWVPPDVIFTRAPDDKYTRLLREAQEANFTMLRIWGGGIYERELFYEECDRLGLLVWQDFMFSCAQYPDHLEWFQREAELEAEFQVRRLRSHPCIALWCGNNEDEWIMWEEQNLRDRSSWASVRRTAS